MMGLGMGYQLQSDFTRMNEGVIVEVKKYPWAQTDKIETWKNRIQNFLLFYFLPILTTSSPSATATEQQLQEHCSKSYFLLTPSVAVNRNTKNKPRYNLCWQNTVVAHYYQSFAPAT